jgi:pimeloyl-ACP methyl ester carboxylesterase
MMDNGISTVPPAEQFTIEASGTRLAVTRAGLGSPIICLHAIGHGARDFARLADELGRQYQFISIDWPGHGASPREPAPAGAVRYAELLESVIDTFGISSAHILGNSVGGAAAIRYAASHPDRVRGLILCNPAGLAPVNFIARLVCRRMAAFFARGAHDDPRFAAQFRRYYERDVLPATAATWRREEIIATAAGVAPILQHGTVLPMQTQTCGILLQKSDARPCSPGRRVIATSPGAAQSEQCSSSRIGRSVSSMADIRHSSKSHQRSSRR